MNAVGDLQGGIEEAERLLGYKVIRSPASHPLTSSAPGATDASTDPEAGHYLIASMQSALSDSDTEQLRDDLMERVGRFRARGIIVDVTALDVMDSFAARSLRTIAHMTRLRGAETVIVGHPARSGVRHGAARSGVRRQCTPRWTWRRAWRC